MVTPEAASIAAVMLALEFAETAEMIMRVGEAVEVLHESGAIGADAVAGFASAAGKRMVAVGIPESWRS